MRVSAGVRKDVSDETVRRVLRGAGYQFLHSRKKGLSKKDGLKKRRKFARKVTKMLTDKFWEEGIDAVGFQHKYNTHGEAWSIRTITWRLKNEGLYPHCTAKGSHLGSGGRVAHHLIVAIVHQKGVVLCEQCEGKINGDMFSDFIKTHFQEAFSRCWIPKGKKFLQDGCPVQNSKKQDKL